MEKLRVEISGDSKDLEKSLQRATNELKDFEKVADKSLGAIEKPAKRSAKGVKGLGKASANATPTLLEFNRVIQDAPFGIQGVANNITQLTQNFGFLKQQTGSTKSALRALVAGFSGPAGILFAVSAVTSILVTYGDQLFSTKSDTEKLADANRKLGESLDKFVESQKDANRALIQGAQNAQKEVIQLGQLRNAAEDTNRSTKDRLRAVQELRRLFPDYFKDLSDEKILTGSLSGVYDRLTESIIKRAKATAATNILVANAEREIAVTTRLAEISEQLVKSKEESARIDALNRNNRSGGQAGLFSSISTASNISSLQKEGAELRKELERILGASIDLGKLIEENGGIDLSNIKLPEGDEVVLRPKVKVLSELTSFGFSNNGGIGEDLADDILEGIIAILAEISDEIDINALKIKQTLEQLALDITSIAQGSLADAFSGIGEAIGTSLIQGGNALEAIGTSIIQSLGGFLSRLGRLLIEYGSLAVIKGKLDLAVIAGGASAIAVGLAAIAIGTALTAAGSAFKNIASNTSGGGSVSSGGSSSSRSFSSSGGGFGSGNVVFEISGRNLVGVLRRNNESNLAING